MTSSTHRIRIHSNPDAVYAAIATTDGMKAWFTPDIEGSFKKGEATTLKFSNGETFTWVTTNLVPNKKVERECTGGPGVAKGTTVKYELEQDRPGETVLKLEHSNWPEGHKDLATCNTLWGVLLGRLRDYVQDKRISPAVA